MQNSIFFLLVTYDISVCSYTTFVLRLFSSQQVIFGNLTAIEAHRACAFDLVEVPLSTLRYHVTKKRAEIEAQELDKENAPRKHPVAAIDYIDVDAEFSPLTENSVFSVSSSSITSSSFKAGLAASSSIDASSNASTKSKLSRQSAQQASLDRLNNKHSKDDYNQRYKHKRQ
jgi:hypothetical protein